VSSELKRELESLRLEASQAAPRRGRGWVVGLVAIALAAGGAFYFTRGRLGAVDVQTVRATRLQTAAGTSAATGTAILTASGYLVARREAVVSAKIQGRLETLRVEEGSVVREGDVLARLESADYEAQLARAKAQLVQVEAQNARTEAAIARAEADLAEARRLLRQAEQLIKDQVVARDTLESSQSRVRVAEAALEQARADRRQVDADRARVEAEVQFAQAQLANTVIRAPFAGTVVKKMAEVGESVAPIPPGVNISTSSGAIVALADLATLEMEADVSESNVARLTESQPAEVEVEAFPDKRYRAVLRQIIPTADRTKATVQVKVTLLDKDGRLKPEMSAKVTFMEPAAQATPSTSATPAPAAPPHVLVPQTAIVSREGGPKVFEIIDNVIKVRPIVTATTKGSDVVVTQGLSGGETLVASPPEGLSDGTRVRVRGT
jgi:RND family efflux transporter MFP subunit